jgi:hypothetical protein
MLYSIKYDFGADITNPREQFVVRKNRKVNQTKNTEKLSFTHPRGANDRGISRRMVIGGENLFNYSDTEHNNNRGTDAKFDETQNEVILMLPKNNRILSVEWLIRYRIGKQKDGKTDLDPADLRYLQGEENLIVFHHVPPI